jgi:hypothetical protein
MATTIPTARSERDAAPGTDPTDRQRSRPRVLIWSCVLAASAAAAVLTVAVLTGGDEDPAPAGTNSGLIEHGSIRSIEGSVEDRSDASTAAAVSGLAEHGSIRSIEGSVEDRSAC